MRDCVICRDLSKSFGKRRVLNGVSWTLREGSRTGLLGASGAGKTTLLRLLAGLERHDAGHMETPATRRSDVDRARGIVGMVFQDLALWPHLTARRHLECVLTGVGRAARRSEAERLLEEVQLPPDVWNQRPGALSGGEAQRLALARALAPGPRLLLLDEPFNQLDPPLRRRLLQLVDATVRARGITLVYVTHSWSDLAMLCERAAVLVEGRFAAHDAVERLYAEPGTAIVARFTGPVVEVPRQAVREGRLAVSPAVVEALPCEDDLLLLRPQQVRPTEAAGQNRWEVVKRTFAGVGYQLQLQSGTCRLHVPWQEVFPPGTEIGVEIGVDTGMDTGKGSGV